MSKTKRKIKVTEPAAMEPVAPSPVEAPEPKPEAVPEPKGSRYMSTRRGAFVTGPITWGPFEDRYLNDAELANPKVARAIATGQLRKV